MFHPSKKNVARLSPSVLSKKRLRDDDHKDEPTLDRTPATCGGSREVGLARRPNACSQDDGSDPREGYVSSIFSETRPRQWQGVRPHLGADKGIYILSEIVAVPKPFSR